MSREEIQKLLGGYATDTLSEAERRALFEAALEDQELFDALAKEQALREVLQDPAARQQLIVALGPAREPLLAHFWRELRKPAVLAMAGGLAALLIVAALVMRQTRLATRREAIVADALAPITAAPPPPAIPPNAVAPAAVPRKLFRPPAERLARSSAPLPAPPPAEATGLSPVRPGASTIGGLAGAQVLKKQSLQAPQMQEQQMQGQQMQAQGFIERDRPPMPAMSRAKATPAPRANRPVEYTLLLKDTNGAYALVPSGTVFHAGDSVRLQVEPSEAGYVYLFKRDDATGGWNLVASQPIEKGQRYELPSTGGLESDIPARLQLQLVLSHVEPVDAKALASQAQASSRITIEFR